MAVSSGEIRAALDGLHSLVERDVRSVWSAVDLAKPDLVRDEFLRFTPELVRVYGDGAATLAADWYDELRAEQRLVDRFRAELAQGVPDAWVQERVRFGAGALWSSPDDFPKFIIDISHGYVTQSYGDTISGATKADPLAVGWERIPNPGACDFCVMLAGRGGVYKKATSRFASHSGCRCSAAPSWDSSAKEVPVYAYKASERTSGMSAAQKAEHNARVREWIKYNQE